MSRIRPRSWRPLLALPSVIAFTLMIPLVTASATPTADLPAEKFESRASSSWAESVITSVTSFLTETSSALEKFANQQKRAAKQLPKEANVTAVSDEVPEEDAVPEETAPEARSPLKELARGYKRMAQTILPLLLGFKATGILVMAMAVTKFVLLKALFLSTTALAIAALLALKKLLSGMGGMGGMGHGGGHAPYTFSQHDLSHVPYLHPEYVSSEPQVTYFGGSYGMQAVPYHGLETAASGLTGTLTAGTGTVSGEVADLQGHYSSQSGVSITPAQVQQLQQSHQQRALLAQSSAGTSETAAIGMSKRRTASAPATHQPYPYRPYRPQ